MHFLSTLKKKSKQKIFKAISIPKQTHFQKICRKEKDIAFTEIDLWHFCFFAFLPLSNKYFSFTLLSDPNIIIMFPSQRKPKVL